MSNLNSPDLDFREQLTRDYILPILPDQWSEYEDLDPEDVDAAKSILAQEYVEHGRIGGILKLLLTVGLWDLLYPLPPVVYGLILSAYGSIFLASPALHTPESLTGDTITKTRSLNKLVRASAEESVKTNVGIVALLGGFVLQIAAQVGFASKDLIRADILLGEISSGIAFVLFFILVDFYLGGPIQRRVESISARLN